MKYASILDRLAGLGGAKWELHSRAGVLAGIGMLRDAAAPAGGSLAVATGPPVYWVNPVSHWLVATSLRAASTGISALPCVSG